MFSCLTLIEITGWKFTVNFVGASCVGSGFLGIFIIQEPLRSQEKLKLARKYSNLARKKTVEKETCCTVVKSLASNYMSSIKILCKSSIAILVFIAAFFHFIAGIAMMSLNSTYFGVFNNSNFGVINGAGNFIISFIANIFTAYLLEKFIEKPGACVFICAIKVLLEIPTLYFIFLQQESFSIAISSLFSNYLVVSGWVTLTLKMLMIVLPKEITGVTNSLFLIL